MPFIETNDHTNLSYWQWGTGAPVVFISGFGTGGAMWEYQMLPLSDRGLRCIGYDRRGHGRSDDPGRDYDFDTFADDLAALMTRLNLHEVTLAGQSLGCGEIARYLSRHGTSRIARVALIGNAISPTMPSIVETVENPHGIPRQVFDKNIERMLTDRPSYFSDLAIKFFRLGEAWPWPESISSEMVQWLIQLALASSPKAQLETFRSHWQTDFRADVRAITVPTLIIHGNDDQNAPVDMFGRPMAEAITASQFKIYEGAGHGLFLTHK
jgi:pimeloyl-ACP methyl ester carboxylesterase